MLLVTTCTKDYGRPWVFPSLGMLHSCDAACLLQPGDARPLPRGARRVDYDAPGYLFQDGRFLDALPGLPDDEIVILADADGVFQRDFSPAELDTLHDLRGGFALGYNVGPGQKGELEYSLLRPKRSLHDVAGWLGVPEGVMRGAWVYNTGFMAARAGAWRHLRLRYADRFGGKDATGAFAIWSWPQYFICLTLSLCNFPVTELGYETHSHGHFPLTTKHTMQRRQLYYDGQLVLYAHNVSGVSH